MIMQILIDKIELLFVTGNSFLEWFLGGFDSLLCKLIIFVALDCFTGILVTNIQKEFSTKLETKNYTKKLCIFILVGIANILDMYVIRNYPSIRTTVILFFLSYEKISLRENMTVIEFSIREKLLVRDEQEKLYALTRTDCALPPRRSAKTTQRQNRYRQTTKSE